MPNFETQRYWDAAAEGELLLKTCDGCGKVHFYPRAICPFCFSSDTRWTPSSGKGRIYSFTIMRRGNPFALAYVELNEGPKMLSHLVNCDYETLRVDQAVRVVFCRDDQGFVRPCFEPDAPA
jgi:uncharacterized protein